MEPSWRATKVPSPELSLGAFKGGLRQATLKAAKGPRPSLFHILQVLGRDGHRRVLDEQKAAAVSTFAAHADSYHPIARKMLAQDLKA